MSVQSDQDAQVAREDFKQDTITGITSPSKKVASAEDWLEWGRRGRRARAAGFG